MRENDVVFLSASVPTRGSWTDGARATEIEEAIVSVARAVFARRGRLLFGGHPSVSPLIAAVAGEYYEPDPSRRRRPVVAFQSRFYERRLPDETHLMVRMGWAAIAWTGAVLDEGRDDPKPSLEAMRNAMLGGIDDTHHRINELGRPVAMIGVGGMEGIVAEAAILLGTANPPPVFLFGSGGGAAARLLDPGLRDDLLWRHGPSVRERVDSALLLDAEAKFRAAHGPDLLPADLPFQPYSAMVQWLLDRL